MKLLEMKSISDIPSAQYASEGDVTWSLSAEERSTTLENITSEIFKRFISVRYNTHSTLSHPTDKVYSYSLQLLSLGCLYLEFQDAIKEGDGLRVLRCYRYLLPMFISSGKKNYAIECLNFLLQHDYLLSPHQVEELIWGRFINTHGQKGRNIPNDLHCEHLNRLCKTSIAYLQANKTAESICRVASALGTLWPLLDSFDKQNGVTKPSTTHKEAKSKQDFKAALDCLNRIDAFEMKHNRCHSSFAKPCDPLHAKLQEDIIKWIKDHISCYFD